MDLVNVLREANKILAEAELPDSIRPVAFSKIFDVLLNSTSTDAPVTPGRTQEVESPGGAPEDDEASIMHRIAEKLGVPVERVREIYFVDGGTLGLALPFGVLSRSISEGARQIATLIVAGRQAAQLEAEGWTHSSEIRKVCDHYGKFDVGNFGKTLRGMSDVFQIKGSGSARQVRPRQLAYERAAELIHALTDRQ